MDVLASGLPINIVVDGNSITDNFYTSIGTFDNHIVRTEPLASASPAHSGHGISGQSWGDMLADVSEVDAAWLDGHENVLVLWETTNAVFGENQTPAQVQATVTDYVSGRLALHPWRIVLIGSIPRGGAPGYNTKNGYMVEVDQWMRDNHKAIGAEEFVDPRVLPIFNHDGSDPEAFIAYQSGWHETAMPWIHPNDWPKADVAELVVAAITSEPAIRGRYRKLVDGEWAPTRFLMWDGTKWAKPVAV